MIGRDLPAAGFPRSARSLPPTVLAAVLVAIVCGAVIAFDDIGFDRPGRFGLDFSHFIIVALIAIVAVLTATLVAFAERSLASVFPILAAVLWCVVAVLIGG